MLTNRTPIELAFLALGFAAWAAVATIAVFGARRAAGGRGLARMRVLLPAWRFFERAGEEFRLELRLVDGASGREVGDWMPAFETARHPGPLALLLNARGNAELAERGLVEQACVELQDMEGVDPRRTTAYALLLELARARLRARGAAMDVRFRFRVTRRPAAAPPSRAEAALISAEHPLRESP
jgi:hypothetical protein